MKSITLLQEESYCEMYRYPTVIIAWIAYLSLISIGHRSLPLGVYLPYWGFLLDLPLLATCGEKSLGQRILVFHFCFPI